MFEAIVTGKDKADMWNCSFYHVWKKLISKNYNFKGIYIYF